MGKRKGWAQRWYEERVGVHTWMRAQVESMGGPLDSTNPACEEIAARTRKVAAAMIVDDSMRGADEPLLDRDLLLHSGILLTAVDVSDFARWAAMGVDAVSDEGLSYELMCVGSERIARSWQALFELEEALFIEFDRGERGFQGPGFRHGPAGAYVAVDDDAVRVVLVLDNGWMGLEHTTIPVPGFPVRPSLNIETMAFEFIDGDDLAGWEDGDYRQFAKTDETTHDERLWCTAALAHALYYLGDASIVQRPEQVGASKKKRRRDEGRPTVRVEAPDGVRDLGAHVRDALAGVGERTDSEEAADAEPAVGEDDLVRLFAESVDEIRSRPKRPQSDEARTDAESFFTAVETVAPGFRVRALKLGFDATSYDLENGVAMPERCCDLARAGDDDSLAELRREVLAGKVYEVAYARWVKDRASWSFDAAEVLVAPKEPLGRVGDFELFVSLPKCAFVRARIESPRNPAAAIDGFFAWEEHEGIRFAFVWREGVGDHMGFVVECDENARWHFRGTTVGNGTAQDDEAWNYVSEKAIALLVDAVLTNEVAGLAKEASVKRRRHLDELREAAERRAEQQARARERAMRLAEDGSQDSVPEDGPKNGAYPAIHARLDDDGLSTMDLNRDSSIGEFVHANYGERHDVRGGAATSASPLYGGEVPPNNTSDKPGAQTLRHGAQDGARVIGSGRTPGGALVRAESSVAPEDQDRDLLQNPQDDELLEMLVQMETEALETRRALAAARHAIDELQAANTTLRSRLASRERPIREAMTHIPTTLAEVLDLATAIWPDRLVALPEARRSAADFGGRADLDEAWAILSAMACDLWKLYFAESSATIAEDFKRASGFELALHEAKGTRDNEALMRSRERVHQGRTFDITRHVKGKAGRASQALRVHYAVDSENRLILIGHCGAHLPTSGDRRSAVY